jgi:hypothetical protein
MSEFHIISTASPPPPVVATSYETQDGTAVPAANILIINGVDSTENNANGIITKGGVAGTGTANEVDVVITNRLQGSVTTVGLVTSPIITFTPTVIGTYSIEARVAVYNTTSSLGAGYSMFAAVRFDGVNSNLCGTPDKILNEEGAMSVPGNLNCTVTVSGADIFVNGQGYAAQTINWVAVGLYTFVGV